MSIDEGQTDQEQVYPMPSPVTALAWSRMILLEDESALAAAEKDQMPSNPICEPVLLVGRADGSVAVRENNWFGAVEKLDEVSRDGGKTCIF